MTDRIIDWDHLYQTGSVGWDRGGSSHNLQYWLDSHLLNPCRILVPGCGNGHEVLALAKLGFDVVAIDIAITAIENLEASLNKHNLKAELVLADFFSWQPEKKMDAVFEQTSLCALSPDRWKDYEKQLYQWLKIKGHLFAQFMQTNEEGGPPYHCSIDHMNALFSKQSWLWSGEHISQEKEVGKMEHLYLLQKK